MLGEASFSCLSSFRLHLHSSTGWGSREMARMSPSGKISSRGKGALCVWLLFLRACLSTPGHSSPGLRRCLNCPALSPYITGGQDSFSCEHSWEGLAEQGHITAKGRGGWWWGVWKTILLKINVCPDINPRPRGGKNCSCSTKLDVSDKHPQSLKFSYLPG